LAPDANSSSQANPFLANNNQHQSQLCDITDDEHQGFHESQPIPPQQQEASCPLLLSAGGVCAAEADPSSTCHVVAAKPADPAAGGQQQAYGVTSQPVDDGGEMHKPKWLKKQMSSLLSNSYATKNDSNSTGGMGSGTSQKLFGEDLLCRDAGVLAARSTSDDASHILHSGASCKQSTSCESELEKIRQEFRIQKWMPWQRNKSSSTAPKN